MNRAEHLVGRTAIVTGAAGGIGEALSRKMAAYGMKLVLTGRNAEKLNAFADELRAGGAEVVTCAGDLADLAFVDETLNAARKAFGGIDVIINNGLQYFLFAITDFQNIHLPCSVLCKLKWF